MSNESENCENTEDKTPGIFSWRELLTRDLDGSEAFYTKLLGWTVDTMDMGGGQTYTMFMNNGQPVCGTIPVPDENVPTHWNNYITVEDLDATLEKAQELGATVVVPAMDIPDKGRFAGIIDPQGAAISFWQFL